MTGLGVMWAVHGASGSFGVAGAATGAFAVGEAVAGPWAGRLTDRYGQRRVVSITAGMFTLGGVLLVAACAQSMTASVLAGLAGWVGATIPPIGALSAARWRVIAEPEPATALSLDGAVNDAAFLIGPVLVTGLGAMVVPWAGLALALCLVSAGTAVLLGAGTVLTAGCALLALAPGVVAMAAGTPRNDVRSPILSRGRGVGGGPGFSRVRAGRHRL
ncbi:MFS transporter [Actinoplanes sp. G11-F43]|uniref:MFS transporter n=1 Tax=Actinoplanes sp. G11-F43 TaxID=3424130 RepID=UPI003D328769